MSFLFSAGLRSTIPDSALFRWKYDEGNGTTAADSIGNQGGTINGSTWASGVYIGDYALSHDGTDDYMESGTWNTFGRNLDTTYTIATTVETTDTLGYIFGNLDGREQTQLRLYINGGVIEWYTKDGSSGTDYNQEVVTDNAYNDGTKKRIVVRKIGTGASNIEIWVNNSNVPTTATRDDGSFGNTLEDLTAPMYHGARNNSGAAEDYLNAIVDDTIIADSDYSDTQIANDYNRQPWS